MAAPESAPERLPPRVGMLATVRNRRGLVTSVEPFDARSEGLVHLVSVEYIDADGVPEDTLVWEREPGARLLEPTTLPDPVRHNPMRPDEFDALVRATRWSALTPYVDPDGRHGPLDRLPISAPLYGAIQVEDFQLVPLLQAMRMPRVSLLLADDVGLGKTIEAGLVLTELVLRRRIRRVLVLCPASLRSQWQQELRDKFSLSTDIVDRPATHVLQKRLGLDANPWRTFPRIITSYDYLKQPDVLEQFRAACRVPEGSPHLPWDLLVVDEVHNLAPAAFGEDSDLSRMLDHIAPWFEHRLFLTATPHNGHTRSFTGLLEYLDPVRFSRKSDALTDAEKARIPQVVVRRLKREINERTNPPRFADRTPAEVPLRLSPGERALSAAFAAFRSRVRSLVAASRRGEQLAGAFAVEVLGKRLLSCPVTFADSWHRYLEGVESAEAAGADEVRMAERATREDTDDDREAEGRARHAARTVGAWLQPLAPHLTDEMRAINTALADLGLDRTDGPAVDLDPVADARFDALCAWIDSHLCHPNRTFRDDERLVLFTEYKTTLDYLRRRLRARYPAQGAVLVLFGAVEHSDEEETNRDRIKAAFNDPADPVRILVGTDAASEGLNLQETARFVFHWDIPWNPARLEQRNGRLDRHGQARDVVVHHFATDDDADLSFLAYVVGKVHTIREDLGATGDVFDRAFERRLIAGEDDRVVRRDLDTQLQQVRGRAALPRGASVETGEQELEKLAALAQEIDLDPDTLRDTLDVALGMEVGRPRLHGPDDRGRFRLVMPPPPQWEALVDDALRLAATGGQKGALPGLLFDASRLLRPVGSRLVFRPEKDTTLLHLGHPIFHHALNAFARARFDGASARSASRWTVRRAPVPDGAEALLLLTVEELAMNELRETFHHWVRTVRVPVRGGELGSALPHVPATALRVTTDGALAPPDIERGRSLWDDIRQDVRGLVGQLAGDLTTRLTEVLKEERDAAMRREQERFQSRQGEVSALIEQTTMRALESEITVLREQARQGTLFDRNATLVELERSIADKEEELRRRRTHYEELRGQLQRERERVLQHILPRRHTLRGQAQVFPVAVEIRLPEGKHSLSRTSAGEGRGEGTD